MSGTTVTPGRPQKDPKGTKGPSNGNGAHPPPQEPEFPISEDMLALSFADEYQNKARFDHHSGKWFLWDGQRWERNETRLTVEHCRQICRAAAAADGRQATAKQLGRYATVLGVERLAQVDERLAVTSDIFDQNPMLLGTPAGTVELETGEIREARQADFITKQTAVAPDGDIPHRWLQFLDEATGGDQAYIDYLQEVCGYCLTGLTIEHALFFIFGKGGNGKSVFLNVLRGILGDYAVTSPIDTFMASRNPQHSTDVASLAGARLVTASETDSDRQWAEAKVKQLTGGDKIAARFMRQDNFEFTPVFKLVIIGNHKPSLRNVDEANKRRFRMLPFDRVPAEVDMQLEMKIKNEWPSILQWMIAGCIQWQAEGLASPERVKEATQRYFSDQDTMANWLMECCETNDPELIETGVTHAMLSCSSSKLFGSWKAWAETNGEIAGSNKWFSDQLERAGFIKKRTKIGAVFNGIAVRVEEKSERYGQG